VGVLQRFERRLEGLVEGAFARVFGGVVQPVEVAAALQREAADRKQIVGQGRVLVPNVFVVEVGASDLERFGEWDEQLRRELASMVAEHAKEQGWSFVGEVQVRFHQQDDLGTGVFRVRSSVLADAALDVAPAPAGPPDGAPGPQVSPRPASTPTRPRLVLAGVGGAPERVVPLTRPVTRVGRGVDADLRLVDTGVSRSHAEVRVSGDSVTVVDLGSTNGTVVNGRRVSESELVDGDRLDIGATALVFRSEA
jgi:hypothetical protein